MFKNIGTKFKILNATRSIMSEKGFDFSAIWELAEPFLTDENIAEGLRNAAAWKKQHEQHLDVPEVAYLVRSTPDGNNIYVDVLQIENNTPVATLAQYNQSNLRELLQFIKNAKTAKK